MRPLASRQSAALLTIANRTALFAKKIFGCHFAWTLVLGSSIGGRYLEVKKRSGILVSILVTR
jgi:hypothetical protein